MRWSWDFHGRLTAGASQRNCTCNVASTLSLTHSGKHHHAAQEMQAIAVCRVTDAVIGFLAEAAAQATRRPHEPWELAQTLLADSAATNDPVSARGVSGLSVCCLRNACKVAASSRMPAEARAAICGFVSGVVHMLSR